MGINISWDSSQPALLRFDFRGEWDRREFEANFRKASLMAQSSPQEVDVLLDFSASRALSTTSIDYARNLLAFIPDNCRAIVVVTSAPEVCAAVLALRSAYRSAGKPLFLADSLEHAYTILPFVQRPLNAAPSFLRVS